MARTKRPGLPGVFVCTNKEETAMANYTFMIVTLIALLVIVGGITFFGVNLRMNSMTASRASSSSGAASRHSWA